MAFHVVSSFLLRVLASKTTLWMAGIFQQPIRCFYFMVFEANTHSKKEDTTWKAMKNWVRECYIFLCTINFEVTWPFWKMWSVCDIMKMGRSCYKCYQENPCVTTRRNLPSFSNRPKFQSNLKYQSISDAVTPHKGFGMKNVKSAVYKMLYDVGT